MTGLFSFLIKKVSKFATENVSTHGVLPLKLVVNAVSTRVLLQFFFPESALCPIFFTLTFLDMIWVHVIHVLGMLGVLGGYIPCFKTLGTCYLTLLCGPNMGDYACKTWQGEKKQGKIHTEEKNLWQYYNSPATLGRGGCCFQLLGHPRIFSSQCQSLVPTNLMSRHIRPTLHYKSRPMCNSNQAFLLVQKLKSAPRVLH
jgi:hypothetical protein